MPAPLRGVYWFYLDNQHVSTYAPIYSGVSAINPLYKTYDPDAFSEDSARWAIDFIDNLLYLRWQEAIKDLRRERDPLEASFFAQQQEIDARGLELFKQDPAKAVQYLTEYTWKAMDRIVTMYRDLRNVLITKYTNNKLGL
jgi:dipeptidase